MLRKNSLYLSILFLGWAFLLPAKVVAGPDGEEVPPGEAEAISQVRDMIQSSVRDGFKANNHAYRDAHRKHHGCVAAKFEILPGISPDLAQGVFATPHTYDSWVRFSNGSGEDQDDHDGDGRGMAVKLLGVTGGNRVLTAAGEEKNTQDFLMINHPVFFVRNALDYIGFQKASAGGKAKVLWWVATHIFHEGKIALDIQKAGKGMTNPLNSRYWSMVPSKMGAYQMKFSAEPCEVKPFPSPSDSKDRLRENLEASMANADACFLFKIQLRTKPDAMPIEDPTIDWSESDAPFVPVAKITIPRQKPSTGEFCETLSYTPWNSLAETRPLGGIQRARKEIYIAVSTLRHELNKQKREEPAVMEREVASAAKAVLSGSTPAKEKK